MSWRVGVEFEWLAPKELSRQTYAQYLAGQLRASVHPFWHPQVEPSKVPGTPLFHNLTQGFAIRDQQGKTIAHTVGDLTIQKQLQRNKAPIPGWFRIVSDDLRLIQLIARQAKTIGTMPEILQPIADLFGTELNRHEGIVRVADSYGSPIALGTSLPGERERVCEVVSGIIEHPKAEDFIRLITPAKALGFSIPIESATHIHFCAQKLQHPQILRNLIHFLHRYRLVLRDILHTNPHCVRLGTWPDSLFEAIAAPDFLTLSWEQVQSRLKAIQLTKFCDFNIKNFIFGYPQKNTFELRILPGLMEVDPILDAIQMFKNIFLYCQHEHVPYTDTVPSNQHNRNNFLVRINHCE